MEHISTTNAIGATFNYSKEDILRLASPMRLYSGSWGAWVMGKNVKPGTLIWLRTRNGKSWFSEVQRVLWEGPSKFTGDLGAICERMDIALDNSCIVFELLSDLLSQLEEINAQSTARIKQLETTWQGQTETTASMMPVRDPMPLPDMGFKSDVKHDSIRDRGILADYREERIRRQKKRIPSQITGLNDYSRLYGGDSAY